VDVSVEHLAELGHTRIGLAVGPERYVPVRRRVAGFTTALQEHVDPSITVATASELVAYSIFTLEGGATATEALLPRDVTAVIFGSDVMALGALRVARRLGLRLPQDLSIIGSDDIVLAEFTDPPLTTVRQPVAEMAEAAVRSLLDEISGDPAPRAEYVFHPELIVRGSTAKAPTERPGERRT
jgi:LacI family repressor for deo operon, udp, cdd, tsx, nupC, and nupG